MTTHFKGPVHSELGFVGEGIATLQGETSIPVVVDDVTQVNFTDGTIEPETDDDVDLGSATKEFKDGYFDGTVYTDALDLNGTAVTSTGAEINKLDDSVTLLTKGAGVSATESYASGYFRNGSLIITRIVVDLTGLVGSATDLDIIGNTGGAASAHWGQLTAALNGTLIGGQVTCLEVPAGGADDVDFYSATVSTGAQDGLVTDLTETALVTSGAAWTSGAVKGMTLLPAANDYLYIVNGEGSAGGTFTAGKFLIEFYGLGA